MTGRLVWAGVGISVVRALTLFHFQHPNLMTRPLDVPADLAGLRVRTTATPLVAATYRARMLSQGHAPKIESRNKPAVTALREIAAGKVGLEMLKKVPG